MTTTTRTWKVWQAVVHDAAEGVMLYWGGTRAEAERLAREAVAEDPEGRSFSGEVYGMTVLASKTGLVGWLNRQYTHDNG